MHIVYYVTLHIHKDLDCMVRQFEAKLSSYVIMNLWDCYEWKTKCGVNHTLTFLQMIICLHSCQISHKGCSCKEKIIMNDDVFVHNICLVLTTSC